MQGMDGVSEAVGSGETEAFKPEICAAACLGIEMEVKCNCFLATLIPLFSFGCLAVGGQQKKTKKRRKERERERYKIDRGGGGPYNDA